MAGKIYTICGFRYEEGDDAFPVTSPNVFNTPEEAYPSVVRIVNATIKDFNESYGLDDKPITVKDCTPNGYEMWSDRYHLNVIIQEHQ